ncbi:hypothetical protein AB6A40_010058 [Gnathostoma spinigerum]|uniref:FERM domain-containing protein n=1 Tax=Gnathostoma spinigerum TaxID=75299 RepID=A0ABD6EYX8_9BILA
MMDNYPYFGMIMIGFLQRHAKGQQLLDKVFEHLELVEKDYFGLQFISLVDDTTAAKRWLDPSKTVRKQMICAPFRLFFRVKFYVSEPSKLVEEYTRYHFFLQLRRDFLEKRITCSEGTIALLSSYVAQCSFFFLIEHRSFKLNMII